MRLTDLSPHFLKRTDDKLFKRVDEITHADGIIFLCPKCFAENGSSVGVHSIICWEPSVPKTTPPTGGRWAMKGSGYDDLSLVAGSSSVLLPGKGCRAHFFVENGAIRMC